MNAEQLLLKYVLFYMLLNEWNDNQPKYLMDVKYSLYLYLRNNDNPYVLPEAYMKRLKSFIQKQLNKERTKPLLFVISELHDKQI